MNPLLNIADRAEKANAGEQRELLENAAVQLAAQRLWPKHAGDHETATRFYATLNAEAYESAAMLLVPEGHHWQVGIGIEVEAGLADAAYAWCSETDTGELSIAATPALALLSAICRAHAQQGGE